MNGQWKYFDRERIVYLLDRQLKKPVQLGDLGSQLRNKQASTKCDNLMRTNKDFHESDEKFGTQLTIIQFLKSFSICASQQWLNIMISYQMFV